jgi:hypothetical protein
MPRVKSNLVCIVLATVLQAQTANAQGDFLGADEMAEAIVAMTSRVWTGPRTPAPEARARPVTTTSLPSTRAPLVVHAEGSPAEPRLARILRSLEYAASWLEVLGWPRPMTGGAGGGANFELYVTSSLPNGGYASGLVPWTYSDRASVFAVVGPEMADAKLDACVAEAYADAMLLSMDPAEAPEWRRATAAWLSWELTGRFGCVEAIEQQQAEPFRSWIAGAAGGGAGGALLLAYLSARHDRGRASFVRDVWTLASQRTWEGDGLRAEPDLWSALNTAIALGGDRLLDNIEDLAVLRWFVGRGTPQAQTVAALDHDAKVSASRAITRLPSRVTASVPLQPFGSAYITLDRKAVANVGRLHAWLRGEYGVRWSFVALQLDSSGNELRRLTAPPTGSNPRAYLPVDIDENTADLLFVVTNLSNELPDADEPQTRERSFELTVDRAD